MARAYMNKKSGSLIWTVAIIVIVALLVMGMYNKWVAPKTDDIGLTSSVAGGTGSVISTNDADSSGRILVDDNIGDASTLTLTAYDKAGNTETSVSVPVAIFKDGMKIYDPTSYYTNSTLNNMVVGDKVTVTPLYPDTADVYYYLGEPMSIDINSVKVNKQFDVWAVASLSSMETTVYDSNNNALDSGGLTNCADYNVTLGADGSEPLKIRVKNKQADKMYNLGGFCTLTVGDVKELEYLGGDASKIAVPQEMQDATVCMDGCGASNTTWDECYQFNEPIALEEWQYADLDFQVTAKSTDPTGDGNDVTCFIALDSSRDEDENGAITDFVLYTNDNNERVREIGAPESNGATNYLDIPAGKKVAVCIQAV